jgi:capsular exopolysaccharide synthesis family protein
VSKLLEMLRKSKGEIADAVAPLIGDEVRPTPEVSAGFKSEDQGSFVPAATAPAAAISPQAPPLEAPSESPIRTVSLRLPAPSPLLPFENSHARPSEQYRVLRTRISHHPAQPSVIVITSPDSGDGKSVTAINTATALALKSDGRVLLLDADLRRSAIHVQLGVPESPGLADVLVGTSTVEQATVQVREFPNLYVMAAGTPPANPAELLDSKPWHSLCTQLRGLFRYVIVDSPPVGGLADYDLIQANCDGVLVVMRPDYTNRDLCWNALRLIPSAKFLGVVLNCIPDWALGRPAESEYYGYSREKPPATNQPDTPQADTL